MEKKKMESMIGRRLIAVLIDILLLTILCFFANGFISQPILNNTTDIVEVREDYIDSSKQYNDIQDEYGIYYYDENGNRHYNEDVSEETKNEFLSDERIISLKDEMLDQQKYILQIFALEVLISVSIGSIIVFIILPLILRKGRTLGKMALKLEIVDMELNSTSSLIILARYILAIIINIYLGIISIGIIPLINLIVAIATYKNQVIYDLLLKTQVVSDVIPPDVCNEIKNDSN